MDDPLWQDQTAFSQLIDIASDDVLSRDVSDTTDDAAGTVKRLAWNSPLAMVGLTPGGRLTLESGVPISTSNQSAKSTLYYTPFSHDFVRLWDGTRPRLYQFTERSLSLTMTSGKNYDVFLYDNSGTLTMELSAAWTTDTARADALAWQAGVGWVKSGTATRLWLGTIRASATNQTEQSFATTDAPVRQFVWNAYNRVSVPCYCHDATDSWTYTTATWRQKRGSVNNQIEIVCGLAGASALSVKNSALADNATNGVSMRCAIGFDSTSAPHVSSSPAVSVLPASSVVQFVSFAEIAVAIGYHYATAMELSTALGTTTWYGDAGGTLNKTAIMARWEC